MVRTFVVHVADHPGVLNRVSSLFRRRGYNIESLTVGHTHIADISRMTVVVAIDAIGGPLVIANLYKLAEVLHVADITNVPSIHRELLIAKVSAKADTRPDLMRVLEAFGARTLEVSAESLVLEATGAEDVIDSLIEGIKPYGILEMTRTGRVAVTRGSIPIFKHSGQKPSAVTKPFWNPAELAALPRNSS